MLDYRLLILGTLVQDSALSIGGSGAAGTVDEVFARDGRNRPIMRGTGTAGALLATARKLYSDAAIPDCISTDPAKATPGSSRPPRSVWRVFNSHPEQRDSPAEPRQGVGIRHDTGAAASGVLFDVETIPRGTVWPLVIEVDLKAAGAEADRVVSVTLEALDQWRRGRCWLGRAPARGLGWMHVKDIRLFPLTVADHLDLWPNSSWRQGESSFERPTDYVRAVLRATEKPWACEQNAADALASVDSNAQHIAPDAPWTWIEVNGTITAGERDGGWGWDGFCVGGHAANPLHRFADGGAGVPRGAMLRPRGLTESGYWAEHWNPDAGFALTTGPSGALEPFVPGGSLRGPIRHGLSRALRLRSAKIKDPNVFREEDRDSAVPLDPVEDLFGSASHNRDLDMPRAGALLVRDAYLPEGGAWVGALLEHHAGDEFTGGVFGSSKFNRAIVLEGTFEWRMVIEAPTPGVAQKFLAMIVELLETRAGRGVPIGSGKWSGLGWVRWSFDASEVGGA